MQFDCNPMKESDMKKFAVLIAAGVMASVSFGDEFLLEGNHSVTVASGTTYTISDKVSGSGRLVLLGGGTLVLNNAENDFTGGVMISNGVLQADASGAFGTGPISLEGEASVRTVKLNAANGVFGNSITLCTKMTSVSYPAVFVSKSCRLAGDLKMDKELSEASSSNALHVQLGSSSADENNEFTVDGRCDVGAGELYFMGYSKVLLKGKIAAGKFRLGYGSSNIGEARLYSSENEITTVRLASFILKCMADDVMKDAILQFDWSNEWHANGKCFVDLNGYSQSFTYLHSQSALNPAVFKPGDYANGFYNYHKEKTSVITLTGRKRSKDGGYPQAYVRFIGKIAFNAEKYTGNNENTSSSYQRFYYRRSDCSGTMSVSGGNFIVGRGAEFSAITNVTVLGGVFGMDAVTNALPALSRIDVKGGTFRCEANCLTPLGTDNADLCIGGEGILDFKEGITNTVRKLFVNGEYMPPGVYTKGNFSFMSASHDTGALVVLRGRTGGFMILR